MVKSNLNSGFDSWNKEELKHRLNKKDNEKTDTNDKEHFENSRS